MHGNCLTNTEICYQAHMKQSNNFRKLQPDSLLIAPSILASDFSDLGNAIVSADRGKADIIHLDIMDGHFVPNLTIGPSVVKSIRHCCERPYDCHLMIDEPEKFIDVFAAAGADNITTHVELGEKIHDVIRTIHGRGCTAGVCLKPATPAEALEPFLDKIELVLVMTVEPGFGGQSFMRDMLPKIRRVREMINSCGRAIHVEVDGGIAAETVPLVTEAGANILVAGTAIFGGGNAEIGRRVKDLRETSRPYSGSTEFTTLIDTP